MFETDTVESASGEDPTTVPGKARDCPAAQFVTWMVKITSTVITHLVANCWTTKNNNDPTAYVSPVTKFVIYLWPLSCFKVRSRSIGACELIGRSLSNWITTLYPLNFGPKVRSTYLESRWMNFISIEWIEVNTLVLPCTTHSRVSGIATGVHVARNTGSLRLQSGR